MGEEVTVPIIRPGQWELMSGQRDLGMPPPDTQSDSERLSQTWWLQPQ